MILVDPAIAREFLEGVVAAFAVLGGVMAYFSGYEASRAHSEDLQPELVTQCINEGLGLGFDLGIWGAIVTLMILGWI